MEVVTPLSDTTVTESDSVSFTCELNKPNKKVTWYKDEVEISLSDTHYTITSEDYSYNLVINDSTLSDTGNYRMAVEDVSTSATLTVNGMYLACG